MTQRGIPHKLTARPTRCPDLPWTYATMAPRAALGAGGRGADRGAAASVAPRHAGAVPSPGDDAGPIDAGVAAAGRPQVPCLPSHRVTTIALTPAHHGARANVELYLHTRFPGSEEVAAILMQVAKDRPTALRVSEAPSPQFSHSAANRLISHRCESRSKESVLGRCSALP